MKKTILFLIITCPSMLWAGVLVSKSGDNIEDVTDIVVSNTKISFIQEGVNKEINRADISAVLYDDGRYEELKDIVMPTTPIENIAVETTTTSTTSYQQSQQTPQVTESLVVPQYVEKGTSANTFNLLAYGQITNGAYVLDHEFDGITIQWRAIIKNGKQVINTDFQYLGTTPFALVTEDYKTNYSNPFVTFNIDLPEEVSFMQTTPFVVQGMDESNKKQVTVEFLLTKGDKSYVYELQTTTLQTGTAVYIPLNKVVTASPTSATPTKASKSGVDYSQYQDGQIHKLKANAYYYVNDIYKTKEIRNVLQTCQEAWDLYNKGHKLVVAGWSTLAASTVMALCLGTPLICCSYQEVYGPYTYTESYYDPYSGWQHHEYTRYGYDWRLNEDALISGIIFTALGGAGFIASIPIICVGHKKTKAAFDTFNSQCSQSKTPVELSFNSSVNGIGMTLKF